MNNNIEEQRKNHQFQDTEGVNYMSPVVYDRLPPERKSAVEALVKTGSYNIVPASKIRVLREIELGNVEPFLVGVKELETALATIKANPELNAIFLRTLSTNLAKISQMDYPDMTTEIVTVLSQMENMVFKVKLAAERERERLQLESVMNNRRHSYTPEEVAAVVEEMHLDKQAKLALAQAARENAEADYELSRALGAKAVNETVVRVMGSTEGVLTGFVTGSTRVALRSSREIAKAATEYKGPSIGILCAFIVYANIYFNNNTEVIEVLREVPDLAEYFGTFFIGALAGAFAEQLLVALTTWGNAIITNGKDRNSKDNDSQD